MIKSNNNKCNINYITENIIKDNNKLRIISGKILDKNGRYIKHTRIKVIDMILQKEIASFISYTGEYIIKNIIPGRKYIISIGTKGFIERDIFVKLDDSNKINWINIILERNLVSITGRVLDQNTLKSIKDAFVILYKRCNCKKKIMEIAYTNERGEFIFSNIPKGEYFLCSSSSGYGKYECRCCIRDSEGINEVCIKLCPDVNGLRGTVSGVITDVLNNPIDKADVILYRVVEMNRLCAIDFTRTNIHGVYLFIDVPLGIYLVKATKKEEDLIYM